MCYQKYKWLLIALIILVSILRPFYYKRIIFLKYILWIVPPIGDYMSVYNTEILAHFNYLSITLIMIVYILVLFGLTIFIFLKSSKINVLTQLARTFIILYMIKKEI